MADERWIPETLFDDLGFRMTFKVERVLYEQQTSHHHLILFEQQHFGKVLMLDGATQVTTADEFVYHEMMTHVPILAHGNAKEVLIVGGGDCGIAEEVLKHKSVKRVTQVEIDASVVEFSKEHFPEFTGPVLKDKRFDLVIDDGIKYVKETDRRFDVVIVDSTDPQGPGIVLFSPEFYAGVQALHEAGRRDGDAERRAVLSAGRTHQQRQQIPHACGRTAIATSRRSRPMSAVISRWAGPPTTRSCASTP